MWYRYTNSNKYSNYTFQDEDTDATAVATINQLEGGIVDGEQAIEFTTQDGQKVRVLTSYHVDGMQLAPEYLTIV